MLIVIPDLLPRAEALALRERLIAAPWVDGNVTSGAGAALAKKNRQLPEDGDAAIEARAAITRALAGNAQFLAAALPRTVFPPLFNRYGPGERFGAHVDNAIRLDPGSGQRIRTDLSATIFLTDAVDYEGGDLVIEDEFGGRAYKPDAGSMLLYPSSSLHRVAEVTKGERVSCFLWLESMVQDGAARAMLYDLDQSVQRLTASLGADDAEVLRLTQLYHNLMRRWATA
ncbi:Fe2+-dependent dioxygenase [Parasphingopyxis marina]|uniref:Fe2+-dependent dioxygenase n=1 Tax=Parasphingopyxis marina TaxID=2761622 RepID=A0A842HW54_9SPHN|nr:Fe2+-dependent dioxygenase [Parasphingopyxis marina]MBC2776713.1 Fe2+-dependent dioxygenase [Parasphingopyxis marina]